MTADLTLFADPVAITAAANGLTPAFGTTLDMTCPRCGGIGVVLAPVAPRPFRDSNGMRQAPCPAGCVNGQRPLPTGPFWVALATLGTEPQKTLGDGIDVYQIFPPQWVMHDGTALHDIRLSSAVAWARIELLPIVALWDDLSELGDVIQVDGEKLWRVNVDHSVTDISSALPFGTWNPDDVALIIHDVNDKMPCQECGGSGDWVMDTDAPCPYCPDGHLSFPIPLPTTPERPTLGDTDLTNGAGR